MWDVLAIYTSRWRSIPNTAGKVLSTCSLYYMGRVDASEMFVIYDVK